MVLPNVTNYICHSSFKVSLLPLNSFLGCCLANIFLVGTVPAHPIDFIGRFIDLPPIGSGTCCLTWARADPLQKHDDNGKAILDSRAFPTIPNHIPTNAKIENVSTDIQTANGKMGVHQKCRVPIQLPTVAPIEVDALISPIKTTKLVSVKKVVDATGPIIFISREPTHYPVNCLTYKFEEKLAICHNGVDVIRKNIP